MRIPSMKGRLLTLSAILFFLIFQTVNQVSAAQIIIVDSRGDGVRDDGNCTLREAVLAANTNRAVDGCAAGGNPTDLIRFDDEIRGGIVLSGELTVTEPLSIEGPYPRFQAISGARNSRVFSAESATVLNLYQLNLHSGNGGDGGLIRARDTDLEIRRCILSNATAKGRGAAIYNNGGRLIMSLSQIRFNKADGDGGAIWTNGPVTLSSNRFFDNLSLAGSGGVMHSQGGTVLVSNTTFSQNGAGTGGGVLAIGDNSRLTIKKSSFDNNNSSVVNESPDADGGVILASGGPILITDSKFHSNRASGSGGAIAMWGSFFNVTDTEFYHNESGYAGGAVSAENTAIDFRRAEFYNNKTVYQGGAVSLTGVSGRFTEGFLTGNQSDGNAGAVNVGDSTINFNGSRFLSNSAIYSGGAVYLANSVSNFDGVRLTNNRSNIFGGAIYTTDTTLRTSFTEIHNNIGLNGGGGIYAGNNDQLTLNNTTFSSNYTSAEGGGLHQKRGTLTITSSQFSNNVVEFDIGKSTKARGLGGGIYLVSTTANVADLTVTANRAARGGGGIALIAATMNGGPLSVTENGGYSQNESTLGGGLWMFKSQASLHSASFDRNKASFRGGGIYIYDNSTLAIAGGQAIGNVVRDGNGGAISARESILRLAEVTIQSNRAVVNDQTAGLVRQGGGIFSLNSQTIIHHSTIRWNSAHQGGGILSKAEVGQSSTIAPSLSILFSTINGNGASGVGGGISAETTPVTIANSTISGNYAPSAAGIHANNSYIDIRHATITANGSEGIFSEFGTIFLRNSVVANNGGANCSGQISGTEFNLSSDNSCPGSVGNPRLGGLADNGGRTATHALVAGSPAIDAAEDSICNAHPITRFDQRLNKRAGSCDLGAFELLD